MAKRPPKERELYPVVARWLARTHRCFKTATNVGLRYGRVDVLGVRDVGGSLSGEVELVSIEVKRGTEPFVTAAGQALGYRVYANRVYLAEYRSARFGPEEMQVASALGIGLIRLAGRRVVHEELSSPLHAPIGRLRLGILERLGLGECRLCGTFFQLGTEHNRFAHLSRAKIPKAIESQRGVMFWNEELAKRKARKLRGEAWDGWSFERRFMCAECVGTLLGDLLPTEE